MRASYDFYVVFCAVKVEVFLFYFPFRFSFIFLFSFLFCFILFSILSFLFSVLFFSIFSFLYFLFYSFLFFSFVFSSFFFSFLFFSFLLIYFPFLSFLFFLFFVMVASKSLNARLTGVFHSYQNWHALSQIKSVAKKKFPTVQTYARISRWVFINLGVPYIVLSRCLPSRCISFRHSN